MAIKYMDARKAALHVEISRADDMLNYLQTAKIRLRIFTLLTAAIWFISCLLFKGKNPAVDPEVYVVYVLGAVFLLELGLFLFCDYVRYRLIALQRERADKLASLGGLEPKKIEEASE